MTGDYSLLEKSLSLVKLYKNEEALNFLDKLIESEPHNNVAWYLKSIIHERLEDFAKETTCFKKAQDMTHLKKKTDCTEILELLDKVFEVFPYDLKGIHIRGHLMAQLREYKDFFALLREHLKLLEKTVEYHEDIPEYDLGYKLIWEKMSSFLDSLARENERVSISKKNLEHEPIILHIGVTLDQFSVLDQIIKWLKFLIEEHEIKSTCLFNNIGVSLVRRIDDSNAISYFEEALQIDQKYIFSLNNLGVSQNSVSFFNDVLKIDDMNITACYNMAFALNRKSYWRDTENLEEALKYCEIVLKKTPKDKECWYLQGLIHEKLGDQEQASESYGKALVISPKKVDLLRAQGELLIKMEKYNEAIKLLDKATELEPGNMYLWEDKVDIYQKLKNEQEEFNCYERMLEEWPGYTSALLGKGRLLVDRGKYDEAVKSLDRVAGGENWDNLWPYAIFHKARTAALQDNKNETFRLIKETIRAGAALCEISGSYREDLDLKEIINKSPEFEKYKSMEEFKAILAHDYNTKEEKDKFWKDIKNS